MSIHSLDLVREEHQLGSLRTVSVLRFGVVIIIILAVQAVPTLGWWEQTALSIAYAAVAIGALAVAFFIPIGSNMVGKLQLAFAIIDVAVVVFYMALAPPQTYLPFLVLTALPILVVLEVSWQRAAVVLGASAIAVAVEVYKDPLLVPTIGWKVASLGLAIYVFLCCASLMAVRAHAQRVAEIARLSAHREQLLAESMGAADRQQRRIAEFIHDGPLQYVLAAGNDIKQCAKTRQDDELDRAMASLQEASRQLREASFELHPEVLERLGLAAAVEKLSTVTADRTGIPISTDIDYPVSDAVDPILYGVARELLANLARHSQAAQAVVQIKIVDGVCHLDVFDNGIGMSKELAAERLAEGHIGLAAHQARVQAAGGSLQILETRPGAHVHVELPLRGIMQPARPVATLNER